MTVRKGQKFIATRATPQELEKLREIAWRRRMSISDLVREALRPMLEAELPPIATKRPDAK